MLDLRGDSAAPGARGEALAGLLWRTLLRPAAAFRRRGLRDGQALSTRSSRSQPSRADAHEQEPPRTVKEEGRDP